MSNQRPSNQQQNSQQPTYQPQQQPLQSPPTPYPGYPPYYAYYYQQQQQQQQLQQPAQMVANPVYYQQPVYSSQPRSSQPPVYAQYTPAYLQPQNQLQRPTPLNQRLMRQLNKPKTIQIPQHCQSCDKHFPNYKMYQNHLSQHVQCEYCDYSSSKKNVKSHSESTHSLNQPVQQSEEEKIQKQWIRVMESPEEIQKWIEERKRNYPTQENIEKKKLLSRPTEKRKNIKQVMNTFRKKIKTDSTTTSDLNKEDDDGPPEQESIHQTVHDPRTRIPCKHFNRGRCKKGQQCEYLHDPERIQKTRKSKKQETKTLTEKLMAFDLKQEAEKFWPLLEFLIESKFMTAPLPEGFLDCVGTNEDNEQEESFQESDNESSSASEISSDNSDNESNSDSEKEDGTEISGSQEKVAPQPIVSENLEQIVDTLLSQHKEQQQQQQ